MDPISTKLSKVIAIPAHKPPSASSRSNRKSQNSVQRNGLSKIKLPIIIIFCLIGLIQWVYKTALQFHNDSYDKELSEFETLFSTLTIINILCGVIWSSIYVGYVVQQELFYLLIVFCMYQTVQVVICTVQLILVSKHGTGGAWRIVVCSILELGQVVIGILVVILVVKLSNRRLYWKGALTSSNCVSMDCRFDLPSSPNVWS